MRAVMVEQFGGPEVLRKVEVPDPDPAPGQVVVDVHVACITFVETQLRSGSAMPAPWPLPVVPGNGVAGVVAALGAGTDPAWLGARVVTTTGGSGGYAERVAVDASSLLTVPDELGLDDAVALLADGRTATMLADAARVAAGDRVLVEAAAGGVGSLLVQLARNAGATVVAAAGGERKLALARELGATVAVDYRDDGWARTVRDELGGVDVVFDGVGGAIGRTGFDLLDRGGRMAIYGLASGVWTELPEELVQERGVTLVRLPPPEPARLRAFTQRALAEAAAGRLRPVVGQRFPLAYAADAHAAIEARATVGKTLLEVRTH